MRPFEILQVYTFEIGVISVDIRNFDEPSNASKCAGPSNEDNDDDVTTKFRYHVIFSHFFVVFLLLT